MSAGWKRVDNWYIHERCKIRRIVCLFVLWSLYVSTIFHLIINVKRAFRKYSQFASNKSFMTLKCSAVGKLFTSFSSETRDFRVLYIHVMSNRETVTHFLHLHRLAQTLRRHWYQEYAFFPGWLWDNRSFLTTTMFFLKQHLELNFLKARFMVFNNYNILPSTV